MFLYLSVKRETFMSNLFSENNHYFHEYIIFTTISCLKIIFLYWNTYECQVNGGSRVIIIIFWHKNNCSNNFKGAVWVILWSILVLYTKHTSKVSESFQCLHCNIWKNTYPTQTVIQDENLTFNSSNWSALQEYW